MPAKPPKPPELDEADSRYELHARTQEALLALPGYFRTKTVIEGLEAQDLFTLNATLGATIEQQVVVTLNGMREVWDPEDRYKRYSFARYAQTFPDVRLALTETDGSQKVAFGIELKGWYLLSKEAEPSFRYRINSGFLTEWDLLVVVPWHLDNVLSGSPIVLPPFLCSARWAAERRNFYWQNEKKTSNDRVVDPPPRSWIPPPFPTKKDRTADKPRFDQSNFGRVARVGIMDGWVGDQLAHLAGGIAVRDWISFFSLHAEGAGSREIGQRLEKMAERIARIGGGNESTREQAVATLEELLELLEA